MNMESIESAKERTLRFLGKLADYCIPVDGGKMRMTAQVWPIVEEHDASISAQTRAECAERAKVEAMKLIRWAWPMGNDAEYEKRIQPLLLAITQSPPIEKVPDPRDALIEQISGAIRRALDPTEPRALEVLREALAMAEQERELYEKSIDGWKFRATTAEARIKALEEAVSALRLSGLMNLHDCFSPITILRWNKACEQADKAVNP